MKLESAANFFGETKHVTYSAFNQDCSCLVVAYEEGGFAIYKVQPLLKMYESPEWFSEMQCSGGGEAGSK